MTANCSIIGGGKGNRGKFIEREPRICAAGMPSEQPDVSIKDCLEHYLLKEHVDALLGDATLPPPKPKPLPPLRHVPKLDDRNAGIYTEVSTLIGPPILTKFQTLAEDFKQTSYSSYWKKPIGKVHDQVPMLPEGLDPIFTTFGSPSPQEGRLYDIVLPKNPPPDDTPRSWEPGFQIDRNYFKPNFNPDLTYGRRAKADTRGTMMKCCFTDDKVILGLGKLAVTNKIQADFKDKYDAVTGAVIAPNRNINRVPEGYTFGLLKPPDNLPECLTFCPLNPEKQDRLMCLKTYNTLRKALSRRFTPEMLGKYYLSLKYMDKEKTGWLPKKVVYDFCASKLIRFDPKYIEPLLFLWNIFDGENIEYKKFLHVLNPKEAPLDLPKILELPCECLNYETTYRVDMVAPERGKDDRPAGAPSSRFLDKDYPVTPENYCKADNFYLPGESNMKSNIVPSILTLFGITHRDMFAKREPDVVRRVFEAAEGKFTDERFNFIWSEAQKFHSQGWVCYETFRRALVQNPDNTNPDEEKSSE